MARAQRIKNREESWRKIVGGFPGGGMSIRAYCLARGVNEAAFYRWRRELARRDSLKTSPTFLPVVVKAGESPVEGVEAAEAVDRAVAIHSHSTIKAGDCGASP